MDSTIDEAKYYTPEFKEFHPGFRFELLYPNTGLWERKWIKEDKPNLRATKVNLEKGRIRVKKLDRDDIESLGWRFLGGEHIGREYFRDTTKPANTATRIIDSGHITIFVYDELIDKTRVVFAGHLRNKSELINQLERCRIKTEQP